MNEEYLLNKIANKQTLSDKNYEEVQNKLNRMYYDYEIKFMNYMCYRINDIVSKLEYNFLFLLINSHNFKIKNDYIYCPKIFHNKLIEKLKSEEYKIKIINLFFLKIVNMNWDKRNEKEEG